MGTQSQRLGDMKREAVGDSTKRRVNARMVQCPCGLIKQLCAFSSAWKTECKIVHRWHGSNRALLFFSAEEDSYQEDFPLICSVEHSHVHICLNHILYS